MHHWLLSLAHGVQVVLRLGRPILDQEPLQNHSLTSKRSSLTKLCYRLLLCLQPEIKLRTENIAWRWSVRMSLGWLSWLPLQDKLRRQRIGASPLHLPQKSPSLSRRWPQADRWLQPVRYQNIGDPRAILLQAYLPQQPNRLIICHVDKRRRSFLPALLHLSLLSLPASSHLNQTRLTMMISCLLCGS
jgi:hypothetical protein